MSTKVIKPDIVLISQDRFFPTKLVDICLKHPIIKRDNHGAKMLAFKLGFPAIDAGCV